MFVHGFTGHPKDTWTLEKPRQPSSKRGKKHGPDGEPPDAARRTKIARLLSSRRDHTAPSTASAGSSHPRPNQAQTADDVVATYEEQQEEVYWPADLARTTVPDSRILTYGYDTHIRYWLKGPVSKKTVDDHAWDLLCALEALRRSPDETSRPLLFVVHSLGGIVVKQALRRSRASPSTKTHLRGIFESTVGVVFFGTPHRGADPRNFLRHLLTASARFMGFQVPNQIVNALMPDTEQLCILRDEFSVMCHEQQWQIYSFQEEYGVDKLIGTKVVDDLSSCLDDPIVETKLHISNNHMDMCRFYGLQDPEYAKVAAALSFLRGRVGNGTHSMSYQHCEHLARGPSQDNDRVNSEPPIVDERIQDTSLRPAAQRCGVETPTTVSDGIDATITQALIDQLFFSKIDERLTSLTAAQGKTCRWFLTKPEYTGWRDVARPSDDGGFLWIKGNPGTGKSTLMKLLFEEAKLSAKGDPSRITLSFFFLARGEIEEKSTTGLYRSLLHQLFEKAAHLREGLEWMTADGARSIQKNGWNEAALKQTLTHTIPKLRDQTLTIFVDALDECDQSQVAGMVCFFEELCDHAREVQVQLQICFSSRHYPTVIIEKGVEVVLEDEVGHIEDIEHYIKSKLRLGKAGKAKHAESLRSELRDKSSGIFLWVVLVLDILNAEYPNSSVSIKAIRSRLEEIPPGLNELFEMILARDGKNLEQLHVCLKWVLFATRSLKPQEFYFAVQLGLDRESSTYWDQEDVELDHMKMFVRTSTKGLAEVTRNKASEVQFIHESVRDFLLGRYGRQWTGVSGNFEGHCHDMLKNCCLIQLNAPIRQSVDISVDIPDTPLQGAEAAQLREELRLKFPFLEYSVLNVLNHANHAQRHGIEQGEILTDFPLPQWLVLNNSLERHVVRQYKKSVNLLYILAEKNLADLIRIHPQKQSCFDVGEERYGPPLFAALATGSHEAVQALLQNLPRPGQHLGFPPLDLCAQYYQNEEDKRTNFGRSFTYSQRKGVLSYLRERGDETIFLAFLLSSPIEVDAKDSRGRTPLSWAARNGYEAIVRLLVDTGRVDVDAKDTGFGQTLLSWAARNGHEAIVRLLVDTGRVDVDAKDTRFGRTPLS